MLPGTRELTQGVSSALVRPGGWRPEREGPLGPWPHTPYLRASTGGVPRAAGGGPSWLGLWAWLSPKGQRLVVVLLGLRWPGSVTCLGSLRLGAETGLGPTAPGQEASGLVPSALIVWTWASLVFLAVQIFTEDLVGHRENSSSPSLSPLFPGWPLEQLLGLVGLAHSLRGDVLRM